MRVREGVLCFSTQCVWHGRYIYYNYIYLPTQSLPQTVRQLNFTRSQTTRNLPSVKEVASSIEAAVEGEPSPSPVSTHNEWDPLEVFIHTHHYRAHTTILTIIVLCIYSLAPKTNTLLP